MNIRARFFGAAGAVTGSKYLIEIDGFNLLVDCGLFQGVKELRLKNWEPFPMDVHTIDAVVLTHAHIDHSGYLPRLVKEGFSGPIYCTEATADLLHLLLFDSAKLQEEETQFAKKKGYSKHENPQPLYNTKDVEAVMPLLKSFEYNKDIKIAERAHINFSNAGHILGASIVNLTIYGEYQTKKIVFSGDLGRFEDPMLYPPTLMDEADILFIESTYGDRDNPMDNPEGKLAEIIKTAMEHEGCILIPAFSVGRTQLVMYYLKTLMETGQIPEIPVYVDSPMAISATYLHKKYFKYHKLNEFILNGDSHAVFDYKMFRYQQSQEESVNLNAIKKNAIIISASGMCTGGRIMHHLYNRLPRFNDTVLFVGYQAEATRGRKIVDGEQAVRIFGMEVPVNCHVAKIDGLSAHADRQELLAWAANFKSNPKQVFVVHGEKEVSDKFAVLLNEKYGWNAVVPSLNDSFSLFEGI